MRREWLCKHRRKEISYETAKMVFPAVQRGFTVSDRLRAGAERHSFFRQREQRGRADRRAGADQITGKMALPEEDIAAVDAWLKDWVQIRESMPKAVR